MTIVSAPSSFCAFTVKNSDKLQPDFQISAGKTTGYWPLFGDYLQLIQLDERPNGQCKKY